MNKKMYKKFSFGLSLNITLKEYSTIIKNYGDYIKEVYFSLPLGKEFHTRKAVVDEYDSIDATKKLYSILSLFKSNGIKLEAVINQYRIPQEKIIKAINFLKNEINVDSICSLDEYIDVIYQEFPDIYLISSFNNLKRNSNDIKGTSHKYNQIVVGKNFLRDFTLLNRIKDEGFSCKLLLNNGCSFNCGSCRSGSNACKKVFEKNVLKISPHILYAIQSFFPSELRQLIENNIQVDEFKISSRPCTYKYLDKCLDSYINNKEEYYINKSNDNYYLWGRLAHFTPYYSEFNYNEIQNIKKYLWERKITKVNIP